MLGCGKMPGTDLRGAEMVSLGSAMIATYAAIFPAYRKSAAAKYSRATSTTPPSTIPGGTTPAKARGNATIEVATKKTIPCAIPNHVPTAIIEPQRARHRFMAFEIALNVPLPSATTKIAARERIQFSSHHAREMPITSVRNTSMAAPGERSPAGDAALVKTSVPTLAKHAATDVTTRSRLSPNGARC